MMRQIPGGRASYKNIHHEINHYCHIRYWQVKKKCPKCDYQWSDDISSNMFNLKKVRERERERIYLFLDLLHRLTSSGSTETRRVSSGSSSFCHSWRLNRRNTGVP